MTHFADQMTASISEWQNDLGFAGVHRITYRTDGVEDWALAWPGTSEDWVVHIHGHGSTGDQPFTRADLREQWLPGYCELGLGILSVNLRGNAWMCPAAAADLHRLLAWTREHFAVRRYYFVSGSMGGTSNLIYGVLHPEDVTAMIALCPATDIISYTDWLHNNPGGVRDEIRQAIITAYGGTPDEQPAIFAAHAALRHAGRLTMPLLLGHGDNDALIPVEQSRRLAAALRVKSDFTYIELPGGHHDSPLHDCDIIGWLKTVL